ncbi:calpain-2 catalytic subunit-like isoform X1 [Alosa sapidissima]|uniref:calpain-2 catalytic subunit-like isoform X1 n=1 Tax=Alosa sapidissima TaxID=34773 RepID=UPI001C093706|nr:calpain-2 catalytic subunit-like isoform X1 [Alosa sapidissima]
MSGIASKLQHNRTKAEGFGSNSHAVPYLDQDYEALKRQCLESGTLFEDYMFGATVSSLGFDELGPDSYKIEGVEWKRPAELTASPQFIVEGATRTDICQGSLGDCWLLAAIASLTLNKEVLNRVVPHGQSFDHNYAGIFHFQIWQYGEWVDVVIDDRLPVRDGKLLFVHSAEGSEFWSALLEKAYAKVNGCYEVLSGGSPTEGFEDFTGGIAERFKLNSPQPNLYSIIQKALDRGSLLGCSINTTGNEARESVTSQQLVKAHAYSITGAEEVKCSGEIIRLIRVRNPWGKIEWKGPWSDSSSEWQLISDADRERLRLKAEDGEFWMAFSDFLEQFSVVEVCNLTPDTLTGDQLKKWSLNAFDGNWRRGSTAGGCRKFPKTFWMNPQFVIRLEEEDDDGEKGCSFLVGLMQKNRKNRLRMGHGQDMHTIGFTIYEVPEQFTGQRNVHLEKTFFLRHAQKARSETFIDLREVVTRFCMPPGEYLIIPSTYKPSKDGDFFVRVFSEKHADLQELDDPIEFKVEEEEEISEDEVDGTFKTLFGKLAGEDSEISAFELKNILNKVVSKRDKGQKHQSRTRFPHSRCCGLLSQMSPCRGSKRSPDINTDGFGLETCRNMINLLDKDGNGTLGLVEFKTLWAKIEKYLKIYRQRDEDNSGTMSSTEMRAAVEEAGFSLNNPLHQILVTRFSNADLTIDFDNFVSCLIRLESMFHIFQTLDTDNSGKVEFNMFQWLYLTLL